MAHLLEHMDFIETTNGRKIKDELVAHGASWKGRPRATATTITKRSPPRRQPEMGAWPRDRSHGEHQVHKELLDTEMTVVRNEFERGENSPASILRERVASAAYLWHNYGKSTIGRRKTSKVR